MLLLILAFPALAQRQPSGCESAKCHVGIEPMHVSLAMRDRLKCVDCHGGNDTVTDIATAHVQPRNRALWADRGTRQRTYAALNQESRDFVRFINPGDLRVADESCGRNRECHSSIVTKVRSSLMSHGAFLWGAALYNNGGFPLKRAVFGESYSPDGIAQKLTQEPLPTGEEMKRKGWIPFITPLPQYEATQPGNTLRVFERGDDRLSNRGFGTLTRTDPVFQGLQRTRLLDPLLYFLGTNDQPGDYRSSGCTACHVVYANDRDPLHSGPYAPRGHLGYSFTNDPVVKKNQEGHPIQHRLARNIPSSQCVVCHIHPGTSYAFQYYGTMWWDNETDGEKMYPPRTKEWKPNDAAVALLRNPEASSLKGNWSDPDFLRHVTDINRTNKQTQFSDFNGHGWIFRTIYKHDKKGNWLDKDGNKINFDDPDKFQKDAVRLSDIHLDKGMHCIDCHFEQDSHGDGHLYGEARAAVEIDCADCHGTIGRRATLRTSNSAAPEGGHDLSLLRTPYGTRRFEWIDGKLIQHSVVNDGQQWEVRQVADANSTNQKAARAHTIQTDNRTFGDPAAPNIAHKNDRMSCYACHTSWMTSCFGCHLSMKANADRKNLHFEGDVETKNYTTYNFQVLRDDVFMLGKDSTVKNGKIAPVRSSSAVVVSSQNANREWIYHQQQTISSEGYSGQAMNPHYPHTVRTTETKECSDCHVSEKNDNNAWMAQLLLQGTNFVNFFGRYIYVGEGRHGFEAVAVTEHDEPQAVYGSYLHKLAYPEHYADFVKEDKRELKEAYEHSGNVLSIQVRGEYAYAAKGKDGIEVYDIANIDNKGFSERMVSAPVSPLGQKFYVKTKDARWLASPTTLGVDPARRHVDENEEQPVHLMYAFLYAADYQEGLIMINAATLLDGDPRNNFLKRDIVFNPDHILDGATFVQTAGNYVYISCNRGIVIVSVEDALHPKVLTTIPLKGAGHSAVQFRYLFALDSEGLKTIDITDIGTPVVKASLPIPDARDIYVARTYAYIAAGKQGVAIVDVENPESLAAPTYFNAGGAINDTYAVRVGMTNASAFAYVADGHNGLRVLQLMSPDRTKTLWGFSPKPEPELIATFKTKGEAIALSKGLDRDRGVDESGNQLVVFGRRGARPFNLEEMRKLYIKDGKLFTVTDGRPQ